MEISSNSRRAKARLKVGESSCNPQYSRRLMVRALSFNNSPCPRLLRCLLVQELLCQLRHFRSSQRKCTPQLLQISIIIYVGIDLKSTVSINLIINMFRILHEGLQYLRAVLQSLVLGAARWSCWTQNEQSQPEGRPD